jgi:hypothetical protein
MVHFTAGLLALLASSATLVSAEVKAMNTPLQPVAQGINIILTWTLDANATPDTGCLNLVSNTTGNTLGVTDKLPLKSGQFPWTVNVPNDTYHFALSDSTLPGPLFSADFKVTPAAAGANVTIPPAVAPFSCAPGSTPAAPSSPSGTPASGGSSSGGSASPSAGAGSSSASSTPTAQKNSAGRNAASFVAAFAAVGAAFLHLA